MIKLFAFLLASLTAFAGSTFIPQAQIPAVVIPIGTVLEYSAPNLPAGDQWDWADGGCLSRVAYPGGFAALGITHGSCDAGTGANSGYRKPDRRSKFARGWTPANILNVQGLNGAVSGNGIPIGPHGFITGMKVRLISGTVPGLALNTDYFAIVDSANYISFATNRANALLGTKIPLSGTTASPVVSTWEDPDTRLNVAVGTPTSGIGTIQDDAFRSHTHTYDANFGWGGMVRVGGSNVSQLDGLHH